MANMPPLARLTHLEVAGTDVDSAGLVAIGALTSLQRLSLTDCQVRGSCHETCLGNSYIDITAGPTVLPGMKSPAASLAQHQSFSSGCYSPTALNLPKWLS